MKDIAETTLGQIMLRNLVVLNPSDTLDKAVETFRMYPFHHLPVVDDDMMLVGMISNTDLERESHGRSLFKHHMKEQHDDALFRSLMVREVMIDAVFQLSPKHSIQDAYQAFCKGRFRAIPIVEDSMLVGIITPLDIIRYLLEETKT
ncbi:MAG: CBS domain-containing protein [Saprospiraceae bacterium]|nr:CBS domain-containing protein [Saprospiraceae bacterium]